MWKNYFKTTYRNLVRNKLYAAINILGLTVGITCFSIIMLYVENELSYDQYQTNESYRFLITEQTGDGASRTFGILGSKTLDEIADKVAGIEDNVLLRDWGAGPLLFEYKDRNIKTRKVMSAESNFFDYIDVDFTRGDKKTALNEPNNVMISESYAEILFGSTNPIGETVKVSGNWDFNLIVTGVFKDLKNSHMDFDVLLNFDLRTEGQNSFNIMREGFANSVYGYFKLEPGTDPEDLAKRVKNYYLNYYADQPQTLEALERESYTFQSIYDIYFESNHLTFDEGYRHGSKDNLWLLGAIGLFILLIACMNYINAATAKSINRTKEIGVRKVFGAFKMQLISQFLGEAFLITFMAVVFSVLLTDLTIPTFENLLQTELRYSLVSNPAYQLGLLGLLITVTFLSGIYPALILSNFKPSHSLKVSSGKSVLKGNGLRKLLVGIQLFLTMALISGVLLISKQARFIQNKDLGFDKENILIIPNNSPDIEKEITTFENELLRSPYIEKVTSGVDVLGFESTNNSGRVILEGMDASKAPTATFFTVHKDYIDVQGLEMVDGRTFDENILSDTLSIIVNEAYLRAAGVEDVVGKKARLWSSRSMEQPIVGVVKDFNFKSLRSEVTPAIFMINQRRNWYFTLKIDPNNKERVLEHARASWDAIEPNYPMGYMFLEDNIDKYYSAENRLNSAIQTFSIICIFIACLGLYGMTAYTLERKIKEIGVRKVLGARVNQLVWLINSRFIVLVVAASLVAIPVVYYLINQWLDTFAYHTEIGWFSFVVSFILVVAIVGITVSALAFKASVTNPAKTLKSE